MRPDWEKIHCQFKGAFFVLISKRLKMRDFGRSPIEFPSPFIAAWPDFR